MNQSLPDFSSGDHPTIGASDRYVREQRPGGVEVSLNNGLYDDYEQLAAVDYGHGLRESWHRGEFQRLIYDPQLMRTDPKAILEQVLAVHELCLMRGLGSRDKAINGKTSAVYARNILARLVAQRQLIMLTLDEHARSSKYDGKLLESRYLDIWEQAHQGQTHDLVTGELIAYEDRIAKNPQDGQCRRMDPRPCLRSCGAAGADEPRRI